MKHIPKALVRDGDRILIIKRVNWSRNFPGHWDLPGGKPKKDETPEQTLIREAKEETNLDVVPKSRLGIYFGGSKDRFEFTVYATEWSGEIKLSSDHSAFRWASEAEIRALKTMPFMVPLLDDLARE